MIHIPAIDPACFSALIDVFLRTSSLRLAWIDYDKSDRASISWFHNAIIRNYVRKIALYSRLALSAGDTTSGYRQASAMDYEPPTNRFFREPDLIYLAMAMIYCLQCWFKDQKSPKTVESLQRVLRYADILLSNTTATYEGPRQGPAGDAWSEALMIELEDEGRIWAPWTGVDRYSPQLLAALRKVRRHHYMAVVTQSPSGLIALNLTLLDLKPHHNVLEIGTGGGYQAAIIAELAGELGVIDVNPATVQSTRNVLAANGYEGIALRACDGALGWPERAPFDRIVAGCAPREIPHALVEQLRAPGKIVMPVGDPDGWQDTCILEKDTDGNITFRKVVPTSFTPMEPAEGEPWLGWQPTATLTGVELARIKEREPDLQMEAVA